MPQPDVTFASGNNTSPATGTAVETLQLASTAHVQTVIGGSRTRSGTLEFTFTTSQTNATLLSATSTEIIIITGADVTNANSNSGNPGYRLGFGSTGGMPTHSSTGVTGIISSHASLAAGSGVVKGDGVGIIGIGAAGDDLFFTCDNPVVASTSSRGVVVLINRIILSV